MKKVWSILLSSALMVSLFAGCGDSSANTTPAGDDAPATTAGGDDTTGNDTAGGGADGDIMSALVGMKIGFSQMENNGSWRVAETSSIQKAAQELGVDLVYTDAQSSTAKQVSDVEDMVAQGVKYIILAPREEEGLQPALDKAKAAGIPVILVDRMVAGDDYELFIGSDFIDEGKRAGEWMVNKLGNDFNVVILEGTPGASAAIDRQTGFEQAIAGTNVNVLAQQTGDFTLSEGQKVMENIIQAHGSNIDAVFCHNDDMALGAIQALKAAGLTPGEDVMVVGVDGCKAAVEAIIAGEMGCTVQCTPDFGPITFETIARLEAGEDLPRWIVNEDLLFDADNAEEALALAF